MTPKLKEYLAVSFFALVTFSVISFLGTDAYAAQKISAGRKIWDTVMLFINFGILVFLFIRYAKILSLWLL